MDFMEGRKLGRNAPQSDTVCVRDFLQSWNLEALEAVRLKHDPQDLVGNLSKIQKKMNISTDTIKELSDVCGSESLFCGEEPRTRKELLEMNSAPSVHLESVRYQMEQRSLRESNDNLKIASIKRMKYSHLDEFTFVRPIDESSLEAVPMESRVSIPNVVLAVQVTKCLVSGSVSTKVRPSETFFVLGTQTLSELKDKMKCPLDDVVAGDFSFMPDVDPDTLSKAKHTYKSGFFFIENVFYNDMRLPDNIDYSKPILQWAESNWPEKKLSVADMATAQFLDLKIKLGCYYLFTHQGNCEHSVLFQDIRLFTSDDAQDLRLYPLKIAERMKPRKLCQGCTKISAKWVVFDSFLIPTDPCFFCPVCFKTFLYTKDGQKTSNFKAHLYAEFCL